MKDEISRDLRLALWEYFIRELGMMCIDSDCFPGEVINARRRSAAFTRIRECIVARMRNTVGYRRGGDTIVFRIFREGRPDDWHPISFPTLGRMLGLHHSTLVLGQQRHSRKLAEGRKLELAEESTP